MPHNPFGNPQFLPSVIRVFVLLVVGLAAVLASQRKPLRVLRRSTFFARARTWLWIAPLFLLCLFTGGFVALVLATFVVLQGLSEYGRLAGIERRYALLLLLWGQVGLFVAALARRYFLFLPFGFFILLTLIPILSPKIEDARNQVTSTLFGYVYIGLPMAYIVYVKANEPWGLNFLVIAGVTVAISDVAAFAVGSALKGPKLAPHLDANKTWTGVLGNLLGSILGVGLLWNMVPKEWPLVSVVVLVVMLALGCVWGDLTEAFVRRDFAGKTGRSILVGYGGILDRVDSLLMAVPFGYYAVILTISLLH